jgi:aspartate kinase
MQENSKKTIVMKFGGASLATPALFDQIADIILNKASEYQRIVTVVSAMGKTTDELIDLARQVNPNPPQREYDMLLSVGERISMALLAMSIAKKNGNAISFTGSQSGIITTPHHAEAKIIDVKPTRIIQSLELNKIVIVAGFQGVSRFGEITTLGRGGSDTTAVALGVALKAEKVEFYKDVAGIFSEDPKKNPNADLYSNISYDSALELTKKGAKILHQRSLFLAKANSIPLHVLSFKHELKQFGGTIIEENTIMQLATPTYEE